VTTLAESGARLLGGALHAARTLQGGDLSAAMHIVLQDGRQAVIKTGPAPRVEAAMLQAIACAGAPAPAVLAVDDTILAIAFVKARGCLGSAWADLGTRLAGLHRTTGPAYGWHSNYRFGQVAIDNAWTETWPAFFAQHRLLTHAPHVPPALAARLETLADDLPNRLPARPPPALLHGDLWGGNILAEGGKIAAFIDPACVFGHAEIDIAMVGLFDHPADDFRASYGALEPGADQRIVIYQLWPALVHLRLFGGAYRGMVESLLSRAGV
jgi:fructosamine-3-kinase